MEGDGAAAFLGCSEQTSSLSSPLGTGQSGAAQHAAALKECSSAQSGGPVCVCVTREGEGRCGEEGEEREGELERCQPPVMMMKPKTHTHIDI